MRNALVRFFLALAAVLALAPAAHAQSQNNQWVITEVFSTRDGKVQFIELTALGSLQDDLTGQELRSYYNGYTVSYFFPSDVPGDSAGHRVLLGTQGYANLGVVAPDFIIPDGFVVPYFGAGLIFGAYDAWYYPELPEPPLSLNRGRPQDQSATTVYLGQNRSEQFVAQNSPVNYAGQTGTVPQLSAPPNYQGLWWNAPANTESGWGLNIAHQGDTLFATWFTYDVDGSAMWLVMPSMRKSADRFYVGDVYKTTGPAYNAVPWNPSAVGVSSFGTATIRFNADGENGVFEHTLGVDVITKNIIRQVFATPQPICAASGPAGTVPVYQDLWWRSPGGSESGWGVNIAHQGNILFATWFTYDGDGRGLWLVMPRGERVDATQTFSGPLYRTFGPAYNVTPFDSSRVVVTDFGSATFAFSGANSGTFTYTVAGVTQSKPITRQAFATPATTCRFP